MRLIILISLIISLILIIQIVFDIYIYYKLISMGDMVDQIKSIQFESMVQRIVNDKFEASFNDIKIDMISTFEQEKNKFTDFLSNIF